MANSLETMNGLFEEAQGVLDRTQAGSDQVVIKTAARLLGEVSLVDQQLVTDAHVLDIMFQAEGGDYYPHGLRHDVHRLAMVAKEPWGKEFFNRVVGRYFMPGSPESRGLTLHSDSSGRMILQEQPGSLPDLLVKTVMMARALREAHRRTAWQYYGN